MKLLSICIIFIIFILVNPFTVKRQMKCEVNKKYCQNNICKLRILSQRFSVIDFHCSVPQTLKKIQVEYKVMRKHSDGSSADIINVREDACKLIKESGSIPIVSRMLPALKKYGLTVKECPVKERLPLSIDDLTCTGQQGLCAVNCSLKTTKRGLNLMDIYMSFPKPLKKVQLHYTLLKKTSGTYKTFMLDVHEDICAMLNGGRLSGFLSRVLVALKEFGFKPPSCPIQGPQNLTGFRMDFSFFPSVIPKGKYISRALVSDLNYNKTILEINQFFTIY